MYVYIYLTKTNKATKYALKLISIIHNTSSLTLHDEW